MGDLRLRPPLHRNHHVPSASNRHDFYNRLDVSGYARRSFRSSSGFPLCLMYVRSDSRSDIYRGQTRGLVPPIHTHHRPQAHPRRPRQPIPQRRHATVLAPLLLERQKLAPSRANRQPPTMRQPANQPPDHEPADLYEPFRQWSFPWLGMFGHVHPYPNFIVFSIPFGLGIFMSGWILIRSIAENLALLGLIPLFLIGWSGVGAYGLYTA